MTILFILIMVFSLACSIKMFIYNIDTCIPTTPEFNISLYSSLVIEGAPRLTSNKSFQCQYKLLFNRNGPGHVLYLLYLETFQIIQSANGRGVAMLNFSSSTHLLYYLVVSSIDPKLNNVLVSRILTRKQFKWNDNLSIGIKIYDAEVSNIKIILTPAQNCDKSSSNSFFECFNDYGDQRWCINSSLKCDKINNCPYIHSDESAFICHNEIFHNLILPLIILLLSLIVLLWVLFKIIPCVFHYRHLSERERHSSVLRSISNQFHLIPHTCQPTMDISDVITPNNVPFSPPTYHSPSNKPADHELPPSYSEKSEICVIPDFFIRFFGKPIPKTKSFIKKGELSTLKTYTLEETAGYTYYKETETVDTNDENATEIKNESVLGTLEAINSIVLFEENVNVVEHESEFNTLDKRSTCS